jgi:hypothetical protein
MAKRIEELEKTVERLPNENRHWKTRLEDGNRKSTFAIGQVSMGPAKISFICAHD